MKLIKRNAFAGEISGAHLDKEVSLNGWVSKIRKLGEIVFLDLRDRTGIVQIFFDKNIVTYWIYDYFNIIFDV